ncbi:mitochondrial uncoupling protein 2-like [Solanum tuberosum]|uniref:mitochondrial uncoupling protein 2-like n=1 Tax=Solanum tuberosum TaxID=4113 RepID=UPI00073A0221|nr:PREDICTED: mitochondrial uncoupling protein 2-like [Solanum tuberosum]
METEAATAPHLAALADTDINWDKNLGYSDNVDKKPSHMQMVAVQATTRLAAGTCSSVIDDYGVGKPSVLKTTKMLLREDGWKGFYRGFGPRFLNMSFYGTTMIVTYEIIKRLSIKQV